MPQIFLFEPFQMVSLCHGFQWFHGLWRPHSFSTLQDTPNLPSIQWGAAFVGFPQGHTGTVVPALLVTLNTFSSHIIFAVGCPLLLFWPLVCEVRGTRSTCSAGAEESEDAVMEMRLRETLRSSALVSCSSLHATSL
ncbi:GPI ethanolamine phosphate transferase [Pimephales promelas]|nr:GPI ethanolamine phosphate transferase [Pimephales promelas]